MPISKPVITVTRKLPDITETRLMEFFDCRLNLDDQPMTQDQLIKAMNESDVLVPTVTDRIDKATLQKAGKRIKLIASFGTGYDHIDIKTAVDLGITVTNTPDVLTGDTADMTMAMILAISRRLVEGEALARSGAWTGWSPTTMLGGRIWGKRIGIIGMGRIGQAVAKRALGFGLDVHYHNRNRLDDKIETELKANYWSSLDQMIAHMDILSVNCPHTPATYHLLNERRMKLMRPDAYIINTSRGEVIDETALIKMLETGYLAGAALDVFENEPKINPRFMKLKNVLLMPHMGSATQEGRSEMGDRVLTNIKAFLDGQTPPDKISRSNF